MMRRAIEGGFFLAALVAGASGCGAGEEGAPAGSGVGIQFVAAPGSTAQGLSPGAQALSGLTLTDERGTVYELTTTRVNLRDIELDLPAGTTCADVEQELAGGARCGGRDEPGGSHASGEATVKIAGPFLVDLLAGTATPDLSAVRVPDLAYARIDFRIEPASGGELGEASWVTTATFGGGRTLDLRLRFNEDIRLEAPGGVAVEPSSPLLVRFDPTGWLAGAGLGACVESDEAGDGAVVVDDRTGGGACNDIEGALKEAVKRSGSLDRGSSDE